MPLVALVGMCCIYASVLLLARPNHIGVTQVDIVKIEGCTIHVKGLDAIDGTPVIDVHPLEKIEPSSEPNTTTLRTNIKLS